MRHFTKVNFAKAVMYVSDALPGKDAAVNRLGSRVYTDWLVLYGRVPTNLPQRTM